MSADDVEQYIAGFDEPRRAALRRLRRSILALVPDAEEGLSYGVPVFRIDGTAIAGFSAAKNHISFLPHSGDVLSAFSDAELGGLGRSKGALRLPLARRAGFRPRCAATCYLPTTTLSRAL